MRARGFVFLLLALRAIVQRLLLSKSLQKVLFALVELFELISQRLSVLSQLLNLDFELCDGLVFFLLLDNVVEHSLHVVNRVGFFAVVAAIAELDNLLLLAIELLNVQLEAVQLLLQIVDLLEQRNILFHNFLVVIFVSRRVMLQTLA